MGYTTHFKGKIEIDKELDNDTYNLLTGLANTRRVKRNVEGYGVDGEFFIEEDDESIIDYNTPPTTQPSLWLQWIPSEDKKSIVWDGGRNFTNQLSGWNI